MRRAPLAIVLLVLMGGPESLMGQASLIPRPRIAFVDLAVKGDVGIPAAGEILAELLLTNFPGKRYQPVERSQLLAILKEQNLTVALVRDEPDKTYAKLKGVKYLVLGSVSKLKSYAVTARLVDVATGDIIQQAEVAAETLDDLEDCVAEAAKILEMTGDEKKAYLDEKQFASVLEQARTKVSEKDYERAAVLYRRCLVIKPDAAVSAELRRAKEEISKALRAFYGKLTIAAVTDPPFNELGCRVRDAIKEVHRRNGVKVTADFGKANTAEREVYLNIARFGKYSEAAAVAKKLNADMLACVTLQPENLVEVRVIAADTGEEILSHTFDISDVRVLKQKDKLVNQDSPAFTQIFQAVMRAWRQHGEGK